MVSMAEPYLSQFSKQIVGIQIPNVTLICKHFFSGAAVYTNGKIIASYSHAGVAIKLPEEERKRLIQGRQGTVFRFFPRGPIKKEYVLITEPVLDDEQAFERLIKMSTYLLGLFFIVQGFIWAVVGL